MRVELFNFMHATGATDAELEGADTGTPVFDEIGTSGLIAPLLTNTDSYSFMLPLPQDIDLSKDVAFRYLFSNSEAAAAGSYIPTMEYGIHYAGTTAMVVAATALDTTFGSQVDLAANIPQWTDLGVISGGKLSAMDADDDHLNVQLTAALATAANISLLRGQMLYYRKTIA